MPNYKPYGYKELRIGTVAKNIPENSVIKTLYKNLNLITTPLSLVDAVDDAVYVVPSGKTFKTYGILVWHNAVSTNLAIHEGATENAETTPKWDINTLNIVTQDQFFVELSFAEDKYITADQDAQTVYSVWLLGYEE